jgi:glycosyltransferase involved in cell wall biosynthesis
MKPILSIVIPVHNEEHFLAGLMESIRLHLTIPYEVIVVDNGSIDKSSDVAERYGCQLVKLPTKVFPSIARNAGAAASKADAIAYLDADVIITKNWADKVAELIKDSNFYSTQKVYGRTYLLSTKPSWLERFWFDPLSSSKKYINGGNILVSKLTNDYLKGFDEKLETGEDVDYCNRAKKNGVELEFVGAMEVHHEGYPKDIKSFYKRERWHGRGDWSSLANMLKSKIALICLSFMLVYLAITVVLVFSFVNQASMVYLTFALIAYIVFVCVFVSYSRFKPFGIKIIMINSLIYFVYFQARINSLFFKS